jgi:hypothetical protein
MVTPVHKRNTRGRATLQSACIPRDGHPFTHLVLEIEVTVRAIPKGGVWNHGAVLQMAT